ncbi:hypothetical protein [Microterricola pindariensis]|uniref:DNA modification methylase n=1 Tax=Microterricola pindariensis TaxID=478010 RepID=A0ABX5AXU6_9MICO|nr:hypothetical protein [Microterricola pindariensis]PPL19702.1 hypothetical protein GY24_04330 [Microterricola pindariensis]
MKARIAASVLLAAGLLVGTAGCNLVAPQATTKHYDASDGVSANLDGVDVRNALVITEDGELGNLVVTFVNTTAESAKVTVQYESDGSKETETVTLEPSSSTPFGLPDGEQITLVDMGTQPGALLPVYFQSGQSEGKQLLVPVLDASLPEYADLVPTAPSK